MSLPLKIRALLWISRIVFGKNSFHGHSVKAVRKRVARLARRVKNPTPVARLLNRTIHLPDAEIPIRVYTPEGGGPIPLLMFFHGGGFMSGNLDTEDELCRILCKFVGCVVVSVEYRLAPEHKFPAASDDCLAASRWAIRNAAELNADPRLVAVAGSSAGGNLAAVTALRIRDEGGPPLRGQLLVYPVIAYHTPPTPSMLANSNGYGLSRLDGIWFWDHYLRNESDSGHPYAVPICAPDFQGLPPAYVITAEYDPLRDEGELYARRLQEAGIPVELSCYDDTIHGFVHLRRLFPQSRQAIDQAILWLQQSLRC